MVNSPVKSFVRIIRGVHVILGTWNGKLDLSIVLMDDFAMIYGLEFFDKVHAFSLLTTNSLSIFDGSKACVVPTESL